LWQKDILLRDDLTIGELLVKINFDDIITSDKSDNEKIRVIERAIYSLRYPVWDEKRASLKSKVDALRQKRGVIIKLPDFAEGNSIDVTFTIKSTEQFLKKLKEMEINVSDIDVLLKELTGMNRENVL